MDDESTDDKSVALDAAYDAYLVACSQYDAARLKRETEHLVYLRACTVLNATRAAYDEAYAAWSAYRFCFF